MMMKAKEKWEPAMVIAICQDTPCSYIVDTLGGNVSETLLPSKSNGSRGINSSILTPCNSVYTKYIEYNNMSVLHIRISMLRTSLSIISLSLGHLFGR